MAFKSVEKVDMHEISKIIHGPKKNHLFCQFGFSVKINTIKSITKVKYYLALPHESTTIFQISL